MRHRSPFATVAIALLAVLSVMAGAPAMACAAMPDCPMMAPASDCHGGPGEGHCAPPQLQSEEDCCAVTATPPLIPAPSSETAFGSFLADVPAQAPHAIAVPAPRAVERPAPPPPRPAGRSLLSLQQTLLI